MGDPNQSLYLKTFHPRVDGPILEVGSKDHAGENHGPTMPFRNMFPDNEYIGVDLEAGKGVDRTIDLVEGIGDLPENYFSLVICCSVLEHVARPWKMAENLTRLLRPGGTLYMSVPWIWRYHQYPDDYFRYSFRGIMALFPELSWSKIHYSTTKHGEFLIVKESCPFLDNAYVLTEKKHKAPRKYMACLMLNMLGTKPESAKLAA
jgi:SAM-dependent methyltransferase